MITLRSYCLLTALVSVLAACGGNSSSSNTSTAANTNSAGTTTTTPSTGTFVDAPVQGLYYSSAPSGLNGKTGTGGSYQYQPGDTVTFVIGGGGDVTKGATLGSATATGKVTPYNLKPKAGDGDPANPNPDYPVNIGQMLQNLNKTPGNSGAPQSIQLPDDSEYASSTKLNTVTFNTDNTSYSKSANTAGVPQNKVDRNTAESNMKQGSGAIPLDFLNTQWQAVVTVSSSQNCPNNQARATATFTATNVTFTGVDSCVSGVTKTKDYPISCLPSNCTDVDLGNQVYTDKASHKRRLQLKLSNASSYDGKNKLVPQGMLTVSDQTDGTTDTLTRDGTSGSVSARTLNGTYKVATKSGDNSTVLLTFFQDGHYVFARYGTSDPTCDTGYTEYGSYTWSTATQGNFVATTQFTSNNQKTCGIGGQVGVGKTGTVTLVSNNPLTLSYAGAGGTNTATQVTDGGSSSIIASFHNTTSSSGTGSNGGSGTTVGNNLNMTSTNADINTVTLLDASHVMIVDFTNKDTNPGGSMQFACYTANGSTLTFNTTSSCTTGNGLGAFSTFPSGGGGVSNGAQLNYSLNNSGDLTITNPSSKRSQLFARMQGLVN